MGNTIEITIANALLDAKEVLTVMIKQGLVNEGKNVFALTNMLNEKYDLTNEQSITVVEQALNLV